MRSGFDIRDHYRNRQHSQGICDVITMVHVAACAICHSAWKKQGCVYCTCLFKVRDAGRNAEQGSTALDDTDRIRSLSMTGKMSGPELKRTGKRDAGLTMDTSSHTRPSRRHAYHPSTCLNRTESRATLSSCTRNRSTIMFSSVRKP